MNSPIPFSDLPTIIAGITLRDTPTVAPYLDQNYGLQAFPDTTITATERPHVLQRRKALPGVLSPTARGIFMLQEHGDTIIEASRDASYVPTVASDGIITSEPNTLLCVVLADCAAILAVDPKTRILGAAHSGWRGTKQNIAGKLIAAMTARGAQASRIRTYISPVACPKHYQVGPEFARYFAATYIQQLHGTACFDNSLAISHQLANAGVGDCTIDTRCTVEDLTLHSHRRDGQQAGRYVAYIGALTET